ncbi:MAG: phosphate ABC transporter permease PstA [Cyanobacteria bacterium MAG STY4_bin_9]|jgi:phosphate transport system permease protein|uniref:phosphate ABC transporter permease PstA n=1 Tax=Synechococcus sp. TAK9802 TaxID=1442558 RepID=UPI000AF238BB|nr:phosphate ABC transporter permease PstA [Synechococcus sp. TAK9802]MBN89760.1 phosphate ABC transporter, permease protein PstA [Synechococcus sp. RS344]MCH1545929.1 phosphate ABC transporter permease PstA [Synechococcus sp. MOX_bin32]MCY3909465.1 phosphate ABC transporter permease PstA [Cyanobacteria bacterium MAG COS3_bin_20]MDD9804612.1 phosphate ABC transporter permease PstA [Cyanobacteria bacterium MAG STY1_bin_7]MDD9881339.1 phosphate ABC transporter permease PstA [Cyanobacteria bacter|tara:strand:- start:987 stop:1904 length:918 start_codon:yes stop_codon:yes gene_type:complete
MTQTLTHNKAESASDLSYKPFQRRNISSRALSFLAALFAAIAVLPLILVLGYVLVQGGSKISLALLTQLPPPPGLEDGGIANAIVGTLVVTAIAALIAVPVGVGGGIFLAEYSRSGWFAQFIRFGTNVLAGVPSIIAGVFIYGTIVTSRILFGNAYSAVAGGMALAVLMLPTVIKTTDEGLKLVPDDLRRGALGVGASRFVTVVRITLPAALTPIATGVVLGIARAAGETAPLIFTALFSPFWSDLLTPEGIFAPIATLSVMIYNFAIMPYEFHNELAWAASFVLVVMILALNLFSRWLARFAAK